LAFQPLVNESKFDFNFWNALCYTRRQITEIKCNCLKELAEIMQKSVLKSVLVLWLSGTVLTSGQVYFEAGPWMRGDMDISVTGGSRAADDGMQAATPGTRGGTAWVDPLSNPDDGTAQILRTFNDGSVGPSGWAWAESLGISQYFAYQNAGQYNATAGTLTFTTGGSGSDVQRRTTTTLSSGPVGWSDSASVDAAGALVTMGYTFSSGALFDWSIQIQAGWLDGIDASFMDQTAWSQQVEWTTKESTVDRSQTWAFTYDTLGNPFFPSAPYEMTDPSGVGPMISDRPISITDSGETLEWGDRTVSRRQAIAVSRVSMDVDAHSFMFALGPRLRFHPTERLSILVQAAATLSLLDAELTRTETFAWEDGAVLGTWADRTDEQEWLWGASASLGLQFNLTDNLYLQGAGGYDWIESTDFTVGPDSVHMDLSGYRAEVALGWRFGR